MIFADKLTTLRKKSGWSQEELAEKMNVSRQSVSKWESAQSVPDLERVLQLATLFGVSTDYLLRDELEITEPVETSDEPGLRRVSMEEANAFLKVKNETAGKIAGATFLCIISPVALIMLCAASDSGLWISEKLAGALGIAVLLLAVLAAVAVFITCGAKTSPYEYLEKESFDTEYGVTGMVRERQKQYADTYLRCNVIGTCLCIFSVIPLLVCSFLTESPLIICGAVCFILLLAGIGCLFFITAGTKWSSMQKLLQEGEYTVEDKHKNPILESISVIYWLSATAVYLAWSFASDAWERSWLVWPVAGVLYAALSVFMRTFSKKR